MNIRTKAFLLALFMLCNISAFAEIQIKVTDLPNPAQTFITKYFEKAKVRRVEKDFDDGQVTFEVKLSGNTEIDFDDAGNWKEVKGKVPADLIPAKIAESVKTDFKNKRIVKIERKHQGGYEIELSNGTDVYFDKDFKVLGVDD